MAKILIFNFLKKGGLVVYYYVAKNVGVCSSLSAVGQDSRRGDIMQPWVDFITGESTRQTGVSYSLQTRDR